MNRLVLALAAGVALFGALLKLTETAPDPSGNGLAPAGVHAGGDAAPSDATRAAAQPASEHDVVALADGHHGDGDAEQRPGTDAPVVGTFELPGPKIAPTPVPQHVAPTSRRSRGERRTRGGTAGSAPDTGIEVGAAGASPASGLGGSGHASNATPTAAGVPAGAANQQGKAQNANADVPQLPPDVAYDSGEELLSTGQPLEVPDMSKIAGRTGTMSLWLQPQWADDNHDDAAILQLGENLQLVKNVNFLRFEMAQDEGAGGIGVPIGDWKAGEWHQVTATWNGNQISLYVDGQLASTATRDSPIDLGNDTNLRIGSNFPTSRPIAPAVIGRVDLRTRPLPATEIERAYARAVDAAAKQATKQ